VAILGASRIMPQTEIVCQTNSPKGVSRIFGEQAVFLRSFHARPCKAAKLAKPNEFHYDNRAFRRADDAIRTYASLFARTILSLIAV
jgi:hypothetical protein